jgi:hypothetical protein
VRAGSTFGRVDHEEKIHQIDGIFLARILRFSQPEKSALKSIQNYTQIWFNQFENAYE